MSELCINSGLAESVLTAGFCAGYLPVNFAKARTIKSISKDSFITLESTSNSVKFVTKVSTGAADSIAENWSVRTLVDAPGLNHGLALHDNFIYASSDSSVYRWSYESNFSTIGSRELVINNINDDGKGGDPGGHWSRTLVFDSTGRLYVSVGSVENVDSDSFRSRIRRFTVEPPFPINFVNGEVFADGVRNEVGLAFDSKGVLWGVENSADQLVRPDLGNDIVQDNPAEELHRFPESSAGAHYGYPYCFTEFKISNGLGKGTVWAWPSFLSDGKMSDAVCRANYTAPALAMQGHSAPLGITFYKWNTTRPSYCRTILPFPKSMDGYAFIAYHGSWNRKIPTGYKVVYVPMPLNSSIVANGPIDLLAHKPPNAQWPDNFRPVDVSFDECGRLLVSSDGRSSPSKKIVRIDYIGDQFTPPSPLSTQAPTKVPSASLGMCKNTENCECRMRSTRTGYRMHFKLLGQCFERCELQSNRPRLIMRLIRAKCGPCHGDDDCSN